MNRCEFENRRNFTGHYFWNFNECQPVVTTLDVLVYAFSGCLLALPPIQVKRFGMCDLGALLEKERDDLNKKRNCTPFIHGVQRICS